MHSLLPSIRPQSRPSLRLFLPDDCGGPPDEPPHGANDNRLSPDLTLAQFFDEWFLPVVLVGQNEARPATVKLYRDALDWWRIITGDPPIRDISDRLVATFKEQLLQSQFRRGLLGKMQTLSRATAAKHLKALRGLMLRLGPTLDPRRPGAHLVQRTPYVPSLTMHYDTKPAFTLEEAVAIAAAAETFDKPESSIPPPHFWRRYLALHLYTGLRSGTLLEVRGSHVAERNAWTWLDVPAELVPKTSKAIRVALHPQAVEAITGYAARPDDPLIPRACHKRWLTDLHEQLQQRAGLPPERIQSPHAWRRTHGEQLARLGLHQAIEVARQGLDHADRRTTETHYVSLVDELRRRLPPLWQKPLFT